MTTGLRSAVTVREVSQSTADVEQASGVKESDDKPVRTGLAGIGEVTRTDSESSDDTSVVVKVLLERLKELQEQLREQQQQLAAAQATSYATVQAKAAVVTAIQGQIADTSGAILVVSGSLINELNKGSGAGAVLNTTA
jgi:hypothetical protein